jgi:hypothetical protein
LRLSCASTPLARSLAALALVVTISILEPERASVTSKPSTASVRSALALALTS